MDFGGWDGALMVSNWQERSRFARCPHLKIEIWGTRHRRGNSRSPAGMTTRKAKAMAIFSLAGENKAVEEP
jgi:hypothetical protein